MSSNALTTRDDPSPQAQLVSAVRSPVFREEVKSALPGNVTPERFVRIAITAVQTNPDLVEADRNSIFRSLLRCAGDGLLPDGREAALVIFNTKEKIDGKDAWVKKAQYMPMIGGFRKIAAEHGWVIRTGVVYENDLFEYDATDAQIHHRPVRPGEERGQMIAAWAKAVHRTGRVETEVMYRDDIERVRQVSKAKDHGPWKDWPDRMWEKSVGRRLFAKLPLGDRELVQRLLGAEEIEPGEATRALYGSDPAAAPPANVTPAAAGAQEPAHQQAVSAAEGTQTPPPAAGAVPGDDDEPAVDRDEPVVGQPADIDEEALEDAQVAGEFVVPSGANEGRTLAELFEQGDDGRQWLVWALRKITDPVEYRSAVWSFCRVNLPEAFQEALDRAEAA